MSAVAPVDRSRCVCASTKATLLGDERDQLEVGL
jgi:hypothetical protein